MTARNATPLLDVELYALSEAARLLQLTTITLKRWLEGGNVSGTFYAPVIREQPTGSDVVTWGEFLEAGMLAEYRKKRKIALQRIRPFVDDLRRLDSGTKYPLAEFQPDIDTAKRELVLRAQQDAGLLETEVFLRRVGHRSHPGGWQVQWAEPVRVFIDKVDFDVGIPQRLYPMGKEKPVAIDPNVVFGIPQVHGIRTEIIRETYADLGNEEEVAKDWGIEADDVRAALQWEMRLRERRKAA
jgi:uncharacterized protein (DUF433 family)